MRAKHKKTTQSEVQVTRQNTLGVLHVRVAD